MPRLSIHVAYIYLDQGLNNTFSASLEYGKAKESYCLGKHVILRLS